MEYSQERIATLHDMNGWSPEANAARVAVVIPMTERDHATLASERLFSALETVAPERVFVALRASPTRAGAINGWLRQFDLPIEVLWCNAEATRSLLGNHGINGPAGKGRDVWLAMGIAAIDHEFILVHDVDSRTVTAEDFGKLLFPLKREYDFVKGYYARVENGRLYGRLFRLFYVPLIQALAGVTETPVQSYLAAFRYALAGEFAASAEFVRRSRLEPGFGLEAGLLGEAFEYAGFEGSAQVDLGRYQHDHRAVSGADGLAAMSREVGAAIFRILEDSGVSPAVPDLRKRYRNRAEQLRKQYEIDAAFNGLSYDVEAERQQIDAYADSIRAPAEDPRLPPWTECDVRPTAVRATARTALESVSEDSS